MSGKENKQKYEVDKWGNTALSKCALKCFYSCNQYPCRAQDLCSPSAWGNMYSCLKPENKDDFESSESAVNKLRDRW